MSGLISGITKFFSKEKIIIFIVLFILGYTMFSYSDSKISIYDAMNDGQSDDKSVKQPSIKETSAQNVQPAPVAPGTPSANTPSGYAVQPVANPSDLLPNDQNSQWSALNPVSMNQGNVAMPDLLQAGYHIGLDTIGQTLRNANLQLRSDPIIDKQNIGPWNQSTIEPDFARVPLEVGYGVR
jgi:hypothetical protein